MICPRCKAEIHRLTLVDPHLYCTNCHMLFWGLADSTQEEVNAAYATKITPAEWLEDMMNGAKRGWRDEVLNWSLRDWRKMWEGNFEETGRVHDSVHYEQLRKCARCHYALVELTSETLHCPRCRILYFKDADWNVDDNVSVEAFMNVLEYRKVPQVVGERLVRAYSKAQEILRRNGWFRRDYSKTEVPFRPKDPPMCNQCGGPTDVINNDPLIARCHLCGHKMAYIKPKVWTDVHGPHYHDAEAKESTSEGKPRTKSFGVAEPRPHQGTWVVYLGSGVPGAGVFLESEFDRMYDVDKGLCLTKRYRSRKEAYAALHTVQRQISRGLSNWLATGRER